MRRRDSRAGKAGGGQRGNAPGNKEKMEKLSEKLSEMKLYQLERSKDKDALEAEIKQLEEQFSALGDNSARLAVALEEQKKSFPKRKSL